MFGAKPVPSIKLATNTTMYDRLTEDMDYNCSTILDGTRPCRHLRERHDPPLPLHPKAPRS